MAEQDKVFDLIIIGSGPAGLSAAIWSADLGLDAVVVEKLDESGGNLLKIYNPITNYPGVRSQNGRELRDIFHRHSQAANSLIRYDSGVVRVDRGGVVELSDSVVLRGRFILFATGVRRRTLGLAGEENFIGRGMLDSGARDPEAVRGMTVAVVGGGDAAAENAEILGRFAKNVYLIHRGSELSAREELAKKALDVANVEFLNNRTVTALHGDHRLESIDVQGPGGKVERIDTDRIIYRIGVVPNSELLTGIVELDPKGYVVADACGRTSVDTIFAVGDVACPQSPTIVTAAGQAAAAAKVIRSILD